MIAVLVEGERGPVALSFSTAPFVALVEGGRVVAVERRPKDVEELARLLKSRGARVLVTPAPGPLTVMKLNKYGIRVKVVKPGVGLNEVLRGLAR